VVIASGAMLKHMTETKKEPVRKLEPQDYEIYHDSMGVMHFLPPCLPSLARESTRDAGLLSNYPRIVN
jgi:hypothetical protein